jgi:hypothetical protein
MGTYQDPGRAAQRPGRLTRRQLLAGAVATVGGLTATGLAAGQEAPADPTKVQGLPPGDAGGPPFTICSTDSQSRLDVLVLCPAREPLHKCFGSCIIS